MTETPTNDINPEIGAMLRSARDFLLHEHSLFRSLGLEPILLGKGRATFALAPSADFADADGDIHGGLSTIILDSIFGLTVFTALEKLQPIATINLRTDATGVARIGERVICEAACDRIDGDIAYVSGNLKRESDGALIARGAGAFMVGTRGRIAENTAKGSRL